MSLVCFDPFFVTVEKKKKIIFGSEAWGNKAKEMYYSLISLKMISFVLFPQAWQPNMNFNISELVYYLVILSHRLSKRQALSLPSP